MTRLRQALPSDQQIIAAAQRRWWVPAPPAPLHPLFLRLFHDTCFIAEADGAIAGFIIGVFSSADPALAYCHLMAVDPGCRRQGIARRLYRALIEAAAKDGRRYLEAVVRPDNRESMALHANLGFEIVEADIVIDGVPATADFDAFGTTRSRVRLTLGGVGLSGDPAPGEAVPSEEGHLQ